MKQKALFFVLLLLLGAGFTKQSLVFAQEENSDNTPTVTEKLKERIDKIVEQRKDKVDQVLGELSNQKRGYLGQVLRVSETTFSLNVQGTTKIVPFDETVKLFKNAKEIKPENVAVDDWATVLGIFEDDEITPKRIEFTDKSPLPMAHLVELGSLKTIKAKTIEFQSRSGDVTKTVVINNKTNIENSEGEDADLDQFTEEDQVLVVGYIDDDTAYATTIRALAPFVKE